MATTKTTKPAAKRAVSNRAAKPAVPNRRPMKKGAPAPAPNAPAGPVIPYHYNAVFQLDNGANKVLDGVLTIDAPIVNGEQYEGLKNSLREHVKLDGTVVSVTITTLHRLDTIGLSIPPVSAPAAKVAA